MVCIGDRNGKGGFYLDSLTHTPVVADDSRILSIISFKEISGLKKDLIKDTNLLNITLNISENSNPVLSLITFK